MNTFHKENSSYLVRNLW